MLMNQKLKRTTKMIKLKPITEIVLTTVTITIITSYNGTKNKGNKINTSFH